MLFIKRLLTTIVSFFIMVDAALGMGEVIGNKAGNFNPGALPQTDIVAEGQHSVFDPSLVDTYRDIFGNSIYHLSQQQGSVLLPFVQMEGMVATQKSINRIGALENPSLYTSRGSTVQPSNPKADVRWLIARRFWQACFVDNFDQVRTLWDIKNAYTVALSNSFGRLYDRVIIQAALGPVCVGPNTSQSTVPLPNTQKRVAFDGSTVDGSVGLNLTTMKTVRRRMKRNFTINKGDILVWVITANETDDLLDEESITSRDFTTILTLMGGEVSAFLGFAFVETELLVHTKSSIFYNPADGKILNAAGAGGGTVPAGKGLRTFCFVQNSALCFGMNQNMFARVSELPRHHYNWQLYYATEIGAMRKEEVQVFEVITFDKDVA